MMVAISECALCCHAILRHDAPPIPATLGALGHREEEIMPAPDANVRLNPSEETIQAGSTGIRFLVTGADSGGSVALFEVTIPAGTGLPAPPHSHDGYEETIYGVAGVLTWTVDGTPFDVGPGQALCIPRGAVHMFMNKGAIDARALCVISPGVLGPAYFRDMGAVIAEAAGGPPDRAKAMEVMRRHGLTPAPPPQSA
jgi:quercetin dioxygenase-like cupin family protein